MVVLKNTGFWSMDGVTKLAWSPACLTAEAVQGPPLALERVDNVEGSDGLAASVLSVGDSVTDHILEEDLEDSTGLLIDEAADALDASTASQAANGGLGDALDVVAKDLAVALGSALAQSLSSLSSARHVCCWLLLVKLLLA